MCVMAFMHSIIESIPDSIRFCCGLFVYYRDSGYGKLNPRAAQWVLNKKYIKVRISSYTQLSTVGAAKPRATQQEQHVVLCHAVNLVGAAKPRTALRPLNKN